MKFCCFSFKFNRKYYPLVFFAIISVIYWEFKLELISGMTLGFLQVTVFKNMKDLLQLSHYQFIERLFTTIGLKSFNNWIVAQPSKYSPSS